MGVNPTALVEGVNLNLKMQEIDPVVAAVGDMRRSAANS